MYSGVGPIEPFFRVVAWLLPAPPLEGLTPLSFEQLREKYRWRDRSAHLLGWPLVAGSAVPYFFLLRWFADWRYSHLDAILVIRAGSVELGFYAVTLSLFTVTYLLVLAYWLFLGRAEFRLYAVYLANKGNGIVRGLDIIRLIRYTLLFCFPPVVLLVALRVDHYTALTDRAVVINPFWSFGTEVTHPYTQVRGLYEVRGYHARFRDVGSTCHVIVFADNTRWRSEYCQSGDKLEMHRSVMLHIAARTGLVVREVPFEEDIPDPGG